MHCPALDCVTVQGLTRGRVSRLFGILSSVRDLLSASQRFSAVIHLGKVDVMVLSVPPGLNARADYWRGKEMCAHTQKKNLAEKEFSLAEPSAAKVPSFADDIDAST